MPIIINAAFVCRALLGYLACQSSLFCMDSLDGIKRANWKTNLPELIRSKTLLTSWSLHQVLSSQKRSHGWPLSKCLHYRLSLLRRIFGPWKLHSNVWCEAEVSQLGVARGPPLSRSEPQSQPTAHPARFLHGWNRLKPLDNTAFFEDKCFFQSSKFTLNIL